MTAPTLLIDPRDLDRAEVAVAGEAYRHLFRAARLAVGDPVRVADGLGCARWARVERVDRRQGLLVLGEAAPDGEEPVPVELLVAPPRGPRAAWLVEKATEMGVAAVRFLAAGRAARGYRAAGIDRLRRVARAAVEQCGRARVPAVTGIHGLDELPRLLGHLPGRWLLDPGGEPGRPDRAVVPSVLLVGPEGGWTAGERQLLAAHGCRPVGLGPRTLRIETAAVAGAALLLLGR